MSKKSKGKKSSLKNLDEQTIPQLTESVLSTLAGFIERELKKPDEDAVWPRKWSILQSNGKNELVVGKIEVQQFTDVRNSSKELGKFYGNKEGFSTIEIKKEDGTVHIMSLENDSLFYVDFGDMLVKGKPTSSKGVAVT